MYCDPVSLALEWQIDLNKLFVIIFKLNIFNIFLFYYFIIFLNAFF